MCHKKLIIGGKCKFNYDAGFEDYWKLTKSPEEIDAYYRSAVSNIEAFFKGLKEATGANKYKDILNDHQLNYNLGHQKSYPGKQIRELTAFWCAVNFGLSPELRYKNLKDVDNSFVDFKFSSKLKKLKKRDEYSEIIVNIERLAETLGTTLQNISGGYEVNFDDIPEKYRKTTSKKCNCFLFRPFVFLLFCFFAFFAFLYYFKAYPMMFLGLLMCRIGLSDYLYERVSRWLLLGLSLGGMTISYLVYIHSFLWEFFAYSTSPVVALLSWASVFYVLGVRLYSFDEK